MIAVREHTAEDSAWLNQLMQDADHRTLKWAEQRISSYLNNKKRKTIFVVQDDAISILAGLVGYAGIKKSEKRTEACQILGKSIDTFAAIMWIAVQLADRRKGIATELLKHCEEWAKDKNKEGIWLDCRDKVIPFYEKAGYQIAGTYCNNDRLTQYVLTKKI